MVDLLIHSLIRTLIAAVLIFLPTAGVAMLMQKMAGRFEKIAVQTFGKRGYMVVFGWLGSAVHELSHALLCVVFRHKVDAVRLFDLNPAAERVGFVRHRYNRRSLYQQAGNFFIALAPIFVGAIVVYAAGILLVPEVLAWPSFKDIPDTRLAGFLGAVIRSFIALSAWENYGNPAYYLFLYILFCIGSGMKLSAADLRGAKTGGVFALACLFGVNLLDLTLLGTAPLLPSITRAMIGIYNIMLLVLVMHIILIMPFLLIARRR